MEFPMIFFFSFCMNYSLVAQTVKRLSTMRETWVPSLGREDPLEKEMAIHSSTIAWKIPWQRSLVGYGPWGCKESDTTERLHFPTSLSIPIIHGFRSLVSASLKWSKNLRLSKHLSTESPFGFLPYCFFFLQFLKWTAKMNGFFLCVPHLYFVFLKQSI